MLLHLGGCSQQRSLPSPVLQSYRKCPDPGARKSVPWSLNICCDVIDISVLTFAKAFDPQPRSGLWPERNVEGPVQEPDSLIIIWLRVKRGSINNFDSFLRTRLMPQSQSNLPGLHTNTKFRQTLSSTGEHCDLFCLVSGKFYAESQ